jgi:cytochrome c6
MACPPWQAMPSPLIASDSTVYPRGRSLLRTLVVIIAAIALFTISPQPSAQAVNLVNGAKLFVANCSACHVGGNNVIIASKTLKKEALAKYNINSLDAIRYQIAHGKNAMPAFKSRLNETQIEDIASYVLSQAEKGWTSTPTP